MRWTLGPTTRRCPKCGRIGMDLARFSKHREAVKHGPGVTPGAVHRWICLFAFPKEEDIMVLELVKMVPVRAYIAAEAQPANSDKLVAINEVKQDGTFIKALVVFEVAADKHITWTDATPA